MAPVSVACLFLLAAQPVSAAVLGEGRGFVGQQREGSLLQTWGEELEGSGSKATPVQRVVKLLEEMKVTLTKEMDEDSALYDKLACWCNTNEYEKSASIKEAEARMSDLSSTIEGNTAKVAELKTAIAQLEADVASNKQALAKATEMREKESKAFHKGEVGSIQAIENLKAALTVLGKHHGAAFPQLPTDSGAFLQGGKHMLFDIPWGNKHESKMELSFDEFLTDNGFNGKEKEPASPHKFLQQSQEAEENVQAAAAATSPSSDWTAEEKVVLQRALHSATTFMQASHNDDYMPSYAAKSGEILGILNELKDQMTADLTQSQKHEAQAAATFAELRTAKSAEIAAGEKQAEAKEDLMAKTAMDLAEAKEDLEKTTATLAEDQKFMVTLKETCTGADKNFEMRKAARLEEIKAVSETISILTSDESKDLFSSSMSFIQVSEERKGADLRRKASALLRGAAAKAGSPDLSILATSVELDTFTRVKKAIDDMIAQLRMQQADELKKHDWCNAELHSNEVATMKTEDKKADLTAKVEDLASTLARLTEETATAKSNIAQLQVDMQRASENRKQENMDFQSTVADQRATMSVLHTALERLAKFYDEEALVQAKAKGGQTPPVPQMEYKKSAGSGGVMSMIEKLITDAKEVEADARKSEIQAQGQYEALVADTNGSVKALQREVMAKTQAKAQAAKDKSETEGDLADTNKELEGLGKYDGELHGDCDYLIKNFGIRQDARGQEIEALQQAKQILSGAMQN
jgi:hypothetical protein